MSQNRTGNVTLECHISTNLGTNMTSKKGNDNG